MREVKATAKRGYGLVMNEAEPGVTAIAAAIVQARARQVVFDAADRADAAGVQVEEGQTRCEPDQQAPGIGREGKAAQAFRHAPAARGTAGRIMVPQAGGVDVGPEDRLRALAPEYSFAQFMMSIDQQLRIHRGSACKSRK